jgi:hypothetical protein
MHTIELRSESSQTIFHSRCEMCKMIISKKSAICSELEVPTQIGMDPEVCWPRNLAGRPPKLRTIENVFHHNAYNRIAIQKQSKIFPFQM